MTNQRIDIDANRWVELRDGLVYFVRFRKRGLEIAIAPWERVRAGDDWLFAPLDRITPATYMCVLAIPIFAMCALAVSLLSRQDGLSELSLAALLAIPVTVLVSFGLRRFAQAVAGNSIPLTIEGFSSSVLARVPSEKCQYAELKRFMEKISDCPKNTDPAIPSGVAYSLDDRGALAPILSSILALGSVAPWFLLEDDGTGSSTISALLALAAVVLAVAQLGTKTPAVIRGREIRRALYDHDLDRASLLLRRKLAEKPKDPQVNFLAMAPALLKGDLETAARHAAIYEDSKRETWNGSQGVFPTAQRLRALMAYERGEYSPSKSEQAALHPTTERVTP